MIVSDKLIAAIRAHAAKEYPRESCGLVVVRKGRRVYIPCRNVAESADGHFMIAPEDYAAAEDGGAVELVVHSHPNVSHQPSQADLVGIERSGLPWLIVNWPTGNFSVTMPTGYEAPLVGRQFAHGILDCYTLVRDYFRTIGIALPDFDREERWWLKEKNLYMDLHEAAGFYIADGDPQQHDMLVMQIASPVPNHAAVYLGDGTILHHQAGRLSSRDVYGGWYRKCTTHIMRHREVKP